MATGFASQVSQEAAHTLRLWRRDGRLIALLLLVGAWFTAAVLIGIDAVRYQRIIPVSDDVIAGVFRIGAGDAVIGKQLAVDADLNAGFINESEARTRRSHGLCAPQMRPETHRLALMAHLS